MLKPEKLPAAMRQALAKTDGDALVMAALERMTVWADLSALVVSALHDEERQRRKASLTYCVMRQAHFGLLHQLFKVSQEAISASLLFLAGVFEFGEGLLHARNKAHGEGGWLKVLRVPRVRTVGYFCSASLRMV